MTNRNDYSMMPDVKNGMKTKKRIILAITGASGAVYGIRTLMALMSASEAIDVHVCVSEAGKTIIGHECGWNGTDLKKFLMSLCVATNYESSFTIHYDNDFFAPPASGSYIHSGMAVVPCSMKTLASVANGISGNLIHRAADVCLKERRPLVMVVRETPLNLIHIENMKSLTLAGGVVMPASPSFYLSSKSVEAIVDTVVARILDHLGIENSLTPRWG